MEVNKVVGKHEAQQVSGIKLRRIERPARRIVAEHIVKIWAYRGRRSTKRNSAFGRQGQKPPPNRPISKNPGQCDTRHPENGHGGENLVGYQKLKHQQGEQLQDESPRTNFTFETLDEKQRAQGGNECDT